METHDIAISLNRHATLGTPIKGPHLPLDSRERWLQHNIFTPSFLWVQMEEGPWGKRSKALGCYGDCVCGALVCSYWISSF